MATIKKKALIIGAGTGGYPCAIRLGQLGVDAMLVEKDQPGGVCLNVGCIPSKALISASKLYHKAQHSDSMGVSFGEATVDMEKMQVWKQGIIKKSDEAIEMAKAQIQALTEDIAQLDSEVKSLTTEITNDDAAKTAAQDQRTTDLGTYTKNKSDLEGTISAIGDAITALQGSKPAMVQSKAVQKALAFVDVYAPQKSKVVHAFLQARRANADPVD